MKETAKHRDEREEREDKAAQAAQLEQEMASEARLEQELGNDAPTPPPFDRKLGGQIGSDAVSLAAAGAKAAPDLEHIARVCHEANRALCQAFGDETQLPWAEAPEWQRESSVKGVQFALSNPDGSPAAQHEAWMADKLANGWRKGAARDPARKVHNCLVPYDELPPEGRAKDYVFRAIVRALGPTVP
jgi:hypothetical protein